MKTGKRVLGTWAGAAFVIGALLGGNAWAQDDGEVILLPAVDRPVEKLVQSRCRRCHGVEGQSAKPYYPKLAGQNIDYLTRQLANFKTGVRTNEDMVDEVADLTAGEMQALAEYFSSKPLHPATEVDPILAELGRRIYFDGNMETGVTACATCHGPDGRGAMYLPRVAGQNAEYIERQIRAFLKQTRTSPGMVMHTVVESMSEAEIGATSHFLSVMK